MTESNLDRLVQDVLGLDPAVLTADLSRDSVEAWDSLNHLRLVTAIESEYGIELTMDEVVSIETIKDIHSLVERHT